MKSNIYAAIDVGTNTFRLLIAEMSHSRRTGTCAFSEIASERIITRLGEGVQQEGLLRQHAMHRSIMALNDFSKIIADHDVRRTLAVATSALRNAKNSALFIDRARDETGIEIKIISGEREAEITATGILIDRQISGPVLIIDIGGGSTELILIENNKLLPSVSLDLGVVYLANRYMRNDPPLPDDLSRMDIAISEMIQPAVQMLRNHVTDRTVFIGTAGTVTTLSAVSQNLRYFDHARIHNSRLSFDNVHAIYSDISVMTARERAARIPYEPERLDIIVPGTLILLKLMQSLEIDTLDVSNYGLREGILVELYKDAEIQKSKDK